MKQPTRLHNFIIRKANIEDVPLILSFITELAEYEKLRHEVVATEALLQKNLFDNNPKAEVIIGELDGNPVCFALFFHNFSTFLGKPGIYLEDLYVRPAVRSQGIGRIMLAYLAKLAIERNCGRLEWWVLDWNKRAIQFYESIGATPMNEWTVFRVTGKNLEELKDEF
ncbi:MAG TPA: GNAT family N-acetyltransferase [bacterium]|nr:GNAT family N-acetyltransferase [bacterium]HMW31995.1 GNAT family N-acetyltransferase [bacterium]HMW35049.1 GNAT family N-acetyltransferase [bacterium]HMY36263.1 GNAT family N-acetyltransferase [bacterium]HMZ05769.1 GNAT family N-acetyltransferase [bacterium]